MNRVRDAHARTARIVRREAQGIVLRSIDADERHQLGQPRRDQARARGVERRAARRQRGAFERGRRQRRGNRVVAVNARDLLDQVLGDREIAAVARELAAQERARGLCSDVDAREQRDHLARRELRAEQAIRARRIEADLARAPHGFAERLDHARRDASARELREQQGRAIRRARLTVGVDAALEAVARLAVQPEPARGLAHAPRVEVRALEQHVRGALVNLALGAAHHAGERDRARVVSDREIARFERAVLAVERAQLLARLGRAHAHRAAHAIEIERVQRLAELEHHEVRHVDDVVDAAHPCGFELVDDPLGRRRHAHAAHDAGRVTRAARAIFDRDAHVLRRGVARLAWRELREAELAAEQRAHLARDAEHRGPVAAVRRELEVEHRVARP